MSARLLRKCSCLICKKNCFKNCFFKHRKIFLHLIKSSKKINFEICAKVDGKNSVSSNPHNCQINWIFVKFLKLNLIGRCIKVDKIPKSQLENKYLLWFFLFEETILPNKRIGTSELRIKNGTLIRKQVEYVEKKTMKKLIPEKIICTFRHK